MNKHIDLWYPGTTIEDRNADQPTTVSVGLMSVRAAADVHIDFDFERNGWRMRMATVHEWDGDDEVCDPKLVEVAFAPAWVKP